MVRFLAYGFNFGLPGDVGLGRRERDSGWVGVSWNHGLVGEVQVFGNFLVLLL
jgi:hypothetical protein